MSRQRGTTTATGAGNTFLLLLDEYKIGKDKVALVKVEE